MKKPASNLLVKIAVPVVVVGAIMIGVKSCTDKNDKNEAGQKTSNVALKDLTPEDLKALGVEGDTAQDTLRTLVGSYRKVQGRLDSLESDNKTLADENKELKKIAPMLISKSARLWGKFVPKRLKNVHN